MKELPHLILGFILFVQLGCNNSTLRQNEVLNDLDSPINIESNIRRPFTVNTDTELLNKYLKQSIEILDKSALREIRTVQNIPKYILAFLDSIENGFEIANPGEEWQEGCIVTGKSVQTTIYDNKTGDSTILTSFDPTQPLPWRQLVYFGLGNEIALMAYFTGGFGKSENIVILNLKNEKVVSYWTASVSPEVTTKEDILDFLLVNKDKHWNNSQP